MNAPDPPDRSTDDLCELADQIAAGLLDRTLAKPRWTHEGHLLACVSLVRRHGPTEALRIVRAAIPLYNEATGVANTPTGGYHDTITVYYVWVVERLLAEGLGAPAVLADRRVERTALLAWWDRDVLMSTAARMAWLAPTITGDGGPPPMEWLQPDFRVS